MAVLDTTEPGSYRREWLPREIAALLTLAGLPLIDGFFLAFLGAGLWRDLGQAVAFGVTAFSGAGCVVAAMQLSGSLPRRIGHVLAVYAVVAAGALAITALQPVFASLLPANLALFTGVFLLGLGLWVSGAPMARKVAEWVGFQAAVKVMLAASLIRGIQGGVTWGVSFDGPAFGAVAVALAAGALLTLAGAPLGLLRDRLPDPRPLNWGACASLVAMGLSVLGWRLPTACVLAPLLAGFVWTLALAARDAHFRRRTRAGVHA